MQLKLEQRWSEMLAAQPESGMGYQRVRVRLKGGRTLEHLTVLNGQVLQLSDDVSSFTPDDIAAIEVESPTP
jgi:hypothetical protein